VIPLPLFARPALPWLGAVALGAALGGVASVGAHLGAWPALGALASALNAGVGPVWVPMAVVALRVGWIALRALRTRWERGALGVPVRPELSQLAPLFAALGLCGTVWGLMHAFEALEGGEFLARLPLLLGGLGAAMASTLVGLGLQIGTLLLGVINPSWSWVRVAHGGDVPMRPGVRAPPASFALDGRAIGRGDAGLDLLVEALTARQPEALGVVFEPAVPPRVRDAVRAALWQRLDGSIPMRELVSGGGAVRSLRVPAPARVLDLPVD
jgi:hypothetical protein